MMSLLLCSKELPMLQFFLLAIDLLANYQQIQESVPYLACDNNIFKFVQIYATPKRTCGPG